MSSFYDANIMLTRSGAPFKFYDPRRPIFTHARFLPGARFSDCRVKDAIVAEGCYLDRATIEALTSPRNYLGLAPAMVDRVLKSATR